MFCIGYLLTFDSNYSVIYVMIIYSIVSSYKNIFMDHYSQLPMPTEQMEAGYTPSMPRAQFIQRLELDPQSKYNSVNGMMSIYMDAHVHEYTDTIRQCSSMRSRPEFCFQERNRLSRSALNVAMAGISARFRDYYRHQYATSRRLCVKIIAGIGLCRPIGVSTNMSTTIHKDSNYTQAAMMAANHDEA